MADDLVIVKVEKVDPAEGAAARQPKKKTAQQGSLFECGDCGFRSPLNKVRVHFIRKHLGEDDVPFLCLECRKRFFGKKPLKDHVKRHHPRKDLAKVCGGTGRAPHFQGKINKVKTSTTQAEELSRILQNPDLMALFRESLNPDQGSQEMELFATSTDEIERELGPDTDDSPVPVDEGLMKTNDMKTIVH